MSHKKWDDESRVSKDESCKGKFRGVQGINEEIITFFKVASLLNLNLNLLPSART